MERTELEQWKAKEVARLLALVETERRYYQEMVATLPVPLVVLSADRQIISANRAFRQAFGLRSKELRGKIIDQILPSNVLIEKIRDVHANNLTEATLSLEHDGKQLQLAVVPIRNWDDDNGVETLVVVQEAPAAAVKPTALDDIPGIVWEADAATLAFKSVHGGVEKLLGYSVEHWTGTPQFFEERIFSEDRASAMKFYLAAIARGSGDASAEFRAMTAAGDAVWVRETIRVNQGVVTGVMTSIELRKQMEDQVLRSGRADALLQMASRLAHDLNNPLMIVNGYAEEMKNTLRPDDPMLGDVNQILTATDRISQIAAQLLNYTRRQADPQSPVNVTRLLLRLKEKIAQTAGEGCAVDLGDATAESGAAFWAMAEQTQLEEIILALVSADREGAKGRTRVAIGCEVDAITEHSPGTTLSDGLYTRLAIHDDGHRDEGARRETVFERILSKPGETTAGPALARAYAIVREWGGDIAYFSDPDRGSTFLVYLPYIAEPATAKVELTDEPLEAVAEPVVEIVRQRILLVEDEAGIRALVRKILRRENYNVFEAGSAEEAMAIAASLPGRIDLLITDVMLPGASGRSLAEHLREKREDLRVLYISGYTDDDAVRAGAIPVGSKFLQKPFTLGSLVGKVKESLA